MASIPMVVADGKTLDLARVVSVARQRASVSISPNALDSMRRSREIVDACVRENRIVYGVTTGVGDFADKVIPPDRMGEFQINLLMSHAVGVGKPLPEDYTRALMLLSLNKFATGFSGVRPQLALTLADMLNNNIYPVIPEKGSVGASGDLAPLAHLGLVMIGHGSGQVILEKDGWQKTVQASEAMSELGISPIVLSYKEGLSIMNSTNFMTALLSLAVHDAQIISDSALVIAAMSMEAFQTTSEALDPMIHQARPHPEQMRSAEILRRLTEGSTLMPSNGSQDVYSFRCIPQVHGASQQAIDDVRRVVETELNACTDNPLVFADEGRILCGGNFHGMPLSLYSDHLTSAMTILGNISERRTFMLFDDKYNKGLPRFLSLNGGLNSGLMMAHYTAASLTMDNMGFPRASSFTVQTSGGKEDHVSNGANAARNAVTAVENTFNILAVEMIAAAQALEIRGGLNGQTGASKALRMIREYGIPFLENDQDAAGYELINKSVELLRSGKILEILE